MLFNHFAANSSHDILHRHNFHEIHPELSVQAGFVYSLFTCLQRGGVLGLRAPVSTSVGTLWPPGALLSFDMVQLQFGLEEDGIFVSEQE
jgi:hypothetical protein